MRTIKNIQLIAFKALTLFFLFLGVIAFSQDSEQKAKDLAEIAICLQKTKDKDTFELFYNFITSKVITDNGNNEYCFKYVGGEFCATYKYYEDVLYMEFSAYCCGNSFYTIKKIDDIIIIQYSTSNMRVGVSIDYIFYKTELIKENRTEFEY